MSVDFVGGMSLLNPPQCYYNLERFELSELGGQNNENILW